MKPLRDAAPPGMGNVEKRSGIQPLRGFNLLGLAAPCLSFPVRSWHFWLCQSRDAPAQIRVSQTRRLMLLVMLLIPAFPAGNQH